MKRSELPWLERLLLALFRGAESEFLVGDLLERYGDDLGSRVPLDEARRRLRRQMLASAWHWWIEGRRQRRGRTDRTTRGEAKTMGGLTQDVRVAVRSWMRRPGFALTVVLTLGVGIGATTTIYSVVDGVMLRPLPYDDPAALVVVGTTFPGREWVDEGADLQHLAGTSLLNYLDFKRRSRTLEELAGVEVASLLLPDPVEGSELVNAARVSPEFLSALRVGPAVGRLFTPEEHLAEGDDVMLMSHATWVTRFGADPAVVGGTVDEVGSTSTVVGVLPAEFQAPEAIFGAGNMPEFWMPLQDDHPRYTARGRRSLTLLARLAPGATLTQARAEMQVIADALAEEFPEGNVYPDGSHLGAGVNQLHRHTVGTTGRALALFLGAAALLLLISALNSATLLLARALDRMQELAVRAALGAGGGRLARMLLTESVLLASLGGVLGLGIAFAGVATFLRFAPDSIPRTSSVVVDGRVLLAAAAISIGAGIVAGLLPAIRRSSLATTDGVATGATRTATSRDSRLRAVLVGGQVAIAVVLLTSAGLLAGSFHRLQTVDPGFEPEGLSSFRVGTKRPNAPPDEETWQAWDAVLEEASRIPGVTAVVATSNPPFQSPWWAPRLLLPGDPPETWREGIAGYAITPGYLEAVGTTLLEGRDFVAADGPSGPWVALVNETFIEDHLEGGDAIGTSIDMPESARTIRVVGVVEDVIQGRAEEGGRAAIYVPYTQADMPFAQVMLRSALPPETLFPEIRRAVLRFSRVVPALDVSTMERRMAETRATPSFQAMLIGSFALVALVLAAAGLYGSLAHSVGRRRRELGIRLAIGANRSGLHRLVLVQGMRVAAIGLVVGLSGALAGSRLVEGFLFGVQPNDPKTLAAVAGALLLVSAVACLVPAWRATAVDPVEVLRAD